MLMEGPSLATRRFLASFAACIRIAQVTLVRSVRSSHVHELTMIERVHFLLAIVWATHDLSRPAGFSVLGI